MGYKNLINIELELAEKLNTEIIIIDPLLRSLERGFSVPPYTIDQTGITANVGVNSLYRKLLKSEEMQNLHFYSLEKIKEIDIISFLN